SGPPPRTARCDSRRRSRAQLRDARMLAAKLLAAAGVRAAVAARVARARAHHAAAALRALDRVLPGVEEGGLALRRRLRRRRCGLAGGVRLCETRLHLGGQDPRLLLLLGGEELLPHPAEDVVD